MAAPLPYILVTWQESTVPVSQFICYRVWRRSSAGEPWELRARITTRTRTMFEDFLARSRVPYEYSVTQSALIGSDEVESNHAAAAAAQLVIRSVFIHAVGDEGTYAELRPLAMSVSDGRDTAARRVWGLADPVALVSPGRTVTVDLRGREPWPPEGETWAALQRLLAAQEAGRQLYVRQERVAGACLLGGLQRQDGPFLYEWSCRLTLTAFEEAPA
ncbi:MAG: hypothetical protein KatS3mg064_2832 [Tepidiforma sp.]|nr:hypothetical protein [Tepidiforma sp.]GIW19675.1 MAG: hypothetical protein KatS3mg064_2832 [Tepidiforma sp.]